LAGSLDGANFRAVTAAGAFGRIDKPWLFADLDLKMALLAFDVFDFRTGNQFDIVMPADLDQYRGDNSHGTVVGGKGLVQLGHDPADAG
jgi:hypothetical protein